MRQVVPDAQNNRTESGKACGRFVYENGKLSYIINADGVVRAVYNTPGGGSVQVNPEMGTTIMPADGGEVLSGFTREIHLKDHLGNVRAVFDYSKPQSENHYYPFGLPIHNLCSSTAPEGKENRYLYNGKELQDDLGLNWMDYGFRMYDPVLGRFPSLDPKADEFNWVSPYNYAENRPIDGIDLWGLQWKSIHDWNQEITDQAHIDNLGDAYFDGMTYAQAWEVRAPAILERLEGKEFDCADLSIYALTEFAAFYKLPIHIADYKAKGTDPTFDNDSYGFQHPEKGWVSFKEGEWQRFAANVGAFYGASDLYNNNKIAVDISFDEVKAGDLIGIKYPSAFHSQTVHSVSRPFLGIDSYTTIQGSLNGG